MTHIMYVGRGCISDNTYVFHPEHDGHLPFHCGDCSPHSVHLYTMARLTEELANVTPLILHTGRCRGL